MKKICLYRGYGPALLQGPFSRFGDTAANVGILALLESQPDLPIFVKTGAASVTAGSWRVFIMPLDTIKTTLQVKYLKRFFTLMKNE